ncbi:MAG: hypothetical protein V7K48_30670 [Nostoc sp.]|uniref:hypothetical protein n=1 Tax=Nostoc sp. TaxID=1180 RepID=UPI002FF44C25
MTEIQATERLEKDFFPVKNKQKGDRWIMDCNGKAMPAAGCTNSLWFVTKAIALFHLQPKTSERTLHSHKGDRSISSRTKNKRCLR